MSELVRVAIVGTSQVGDAAADLTGTAADELIAKLPSSERERAFLLRAGAYATLRRAASLVHKRESPSESAVRDTMRPISERLTDILRTLLAGQDNELLAEALERAAKAKLRLSPELLPFALGQTAQARRALLKPLLGARGQWLAKLRPQWSWALATAANDAELPSDYEQRWSEGSASERKALFALLRKQAPELSRKLLAASWKQDKVDLRLAFLDVLASHLEQADEPLLSDMLGDRSANVRVAAARLLWRIPSSAVAARVRDRARALVSYKAGKLDVQLPPERFDPEWERDGLVEAVPKQGVGKRQWWLMQLLSAVPPDSWLPSTQSSPAELLEAAAAHEFGGVLLDGISSAALTHDSKRWIAPLWDVWAKGGIASMQTPHPLIALSPHLPSADVEPRALALLARDESVGLLLHLPRPWPHAVALRFLQSLDNLRPFPQLLSAAALAIPVYLLPDHVTLPEVPDNDYAARAFVRALEQFQALATMRRNIAQETSHD